MKIGKIYRYSSQTLKKDPSLPVVDGLSNFFYHTNDPKSITQVIFQRGIHSIQEVSGDGIVRRPAIIISSSPHKVGTEQTPWEDSYDPDYGCVRYYGESKSNITRPENTAGNRLLLDAFKLHSSPKEEDRRLATPIIFFNRVPFEGRSKGNLLFQGFGIVERAELVTQYDSNGNYFTNYAFDLCVFSLQKENEDFSWKWINARRDKDLSIDETLKLAPDSWKKWIKRGSHHLSEVRRKVSTLSIVKMHDQQPTAGTKEEKTLSQIYNYYQSSRHSFELLALRVTEYIFEESGSKLLQGWVTQKSSDGGVDFVTRLDIGQGLAGTKLVVLGQAKCESPNKPTNGQNIARTVARLKRGWIGVYVTTSYFSASVQQEVIDDQYPMILVNGLKMAETVEKILYAEGTTLQNYLIELDDQYNVLVKARRPDEILTI
jgi:hypothetical protein